MKIAVTYENEQVFQHFGHTEKFKIYEVQNDEIVNMQVVNTNGSGHGALSGFLKDNGVDVLICGGIGGGTALHPFYFFPDAVDPFLCRGRDDLCDSSGTYSCAEQR